MIAGDGSTVRVRSSLVGIGAPLPPDVPPHGPCPFLAPSHSRICPSRPSASTGRVAPETPPDPRGASEKSESGRSRWPVGYLWHISANPTEIRRSPQRAADHRKAFYAAPEEWGQKNPIKWLVMGNVTIIPVFVSLITSMLAVGVNGL